MNNPQNNAPLPTAESPAPASPSPRPKPRNPKPVVTYVIMGVTILVYIAQKLTPVGNGLDELLLWGAMRADLIMQGQIWRLLTPALLHFSEIHIGANMYSLYVLGPALEQFFGRWRYLALYVLCALGGNLLSFYMNTNAIAAGASTAIFGLIAAQGVFIYLNRELFGDRARGMLQNVGFLVILNLGIGFYMGFDNWGHMGGLITGLAYAWFAGPQLQLARRETGGFNLVDSRSTTNVIIASLLITAVLVSLAFVRILSH